MATKVDGSLEDLYELVYRYCNLEPVQALLRRYKNSESLPEANRDDIRISGENARAIVTDNLRTAVNRKAIPIEEVFSLLREAEENGSQHIFFFRPKTKKVQTLFSDAASIGAGLLGSSWSDAKIFPRLRLQPDGYTWADFRTVGKMGWIAKLYGHDIVEEKLSVSDEEIESGERIKWIKLKVLDRRTVCLVRWRPNSNLLELRVDHRAAKLLLTELKKQLLPIIDVERQFQPWDMSSIRQKIFQNHKLRSETYEIGSWTVGDSESYALEGVPHLQDPDEKTQASASMRELISQVASSEDFEKKKIVVHWKPTKSNDNKKNLRTIIGTISNSHELIISAQASSRAIDDVVDQLLSFEE